jgi:WD40 repeat protein
MTTVVQGAIDEQNPWPGLGSFDEASERFFNGRRNESAELRRMVLNAPLTVLFGASGLGKTSLVQAGLFPLLRKEHYLPVYVRLDLEGGSGPLIDQVKCVLLAQFEAERIDTPATPDDESLWCYLHRVKLELWSEQNHLLTPVFVFDQFEEVFTLGSGNRAAVARLRIDLADLIENRLPIALAGNIENDEKAGAALSLDSQNYKVLLSFREDFLPAVESWKRDLPSILRNRLRLLPMSPQRAFEAVHKTAPHLVDEHLAEKIVDFVAAAQGNETGNASEELGQKRESSVEPALLSLVCRGLNEKRKAQGKLTFDADLLAGSGQAIVSDYYHEAMGDLSSPARHFIQNELITERGFRKACALDDAIAVHGVTDRDLRLLVDRRLLRIERQSGVDRVELTHDLLAPVVREDRDYERERTRVRRQRRHMGMFAVVVLSLATLAFVFLRLFLDARESGETLKTEHAALSHTYDQLSKVRDDLSTRANELKTANASLAGANTKLKNTNASLNVAKSKLKTKNTELDRTNTKLGDTITELFIEKHAKEVALDDSQHLERLQSARALAATAMTEVLDRPSDALALAVYSIRASVTREGLDALARALPNSALRFTLDGQCGDIVSVTFGDGAFITVACADASTRQWKISGDTYKISRCAKCDAIHAPSLALSPDGKLLALSQAEVLTSRGNVGLAQGHGKDPGGKNVGRNSAVWLTNVYWTGGHNSLPTHWYVPTAMGFSGDSRFLAVGGGLSRRTVFDLASKKELWTSFSQRLVRLLTRAETATFGKAPEFATRVAFSPDERLLVFGRDDGIVEFWNVEKGTNTGFLRAHGASIEGLAFSGNGEYLATGGRDNLARIWKLSADVAKIAGKPLIGHSDAVIALAFSPNSKFVATGSQDRTINVWDVESSRLLRTFTGHSGYVTSLAFNPQGTLLASSSRDGTIKVWDVSSIERVNSLLERVSDILQSATTFDQNGEAKDTSVSGLILDVVQLGLPSLSPDQCKLYFQSENCPSIP